MQEYNPMTNTLDALIQASDEIQEWMRDNGFQNAKHDGEFIFIPFTNALNEIKRNPPRLHSDFSREGGKKSKPNAHLNLGKYAKKAKKKEIPA